MPIALAISQKLSYLTVHGLFDPSFDATLVCVRVKQSGQSLLVVSQVAYGPTNPAKV